MHARRWSGYESLGNGCLSSFYFYLLALLTILTLFSGCAKEQKVCAKCQCCVDQIVERKNNLLNALK
ncbi:hypothetical protein V6N11_072761 [Hibiscus sabdariffa]|uniref:Uncharacterized protein n=1 Tax=Hibiscus sabdariffa TaxID=183260 RepID=A0ABR2NE52_9ROSI